MGSDHTGTGGDAPARPAKPGLDGNRARIDAVSKLLYELNNPLQILMTLAEMDGNKEYSRQVARILEVVNDMRRDACLDLVVGENGKTRYKSPEPVGLTPVDGSRVLIADDDPMVRKVFSGAIARSLPGVRIDEASDGKQAVELFERHHHGAIIIDVVMPGMSGEDSFKSIRTRCEEKFWQMPPFIFCTGYKVTPSLLALVGESEMHTCLTKPLGVADLVKAVADRLARAGRD